MFVSLAWGVLFLTDTLQIWHACVLLVLHGMAGALWGPAEQLMLHDFVGTEDLPSAVRLNATVQEPRRPLRPGGRLRAAARARPDRRDLRQRRRSTCR